MKTYDLNLLRTLDALLSAGSVTAAAERMHLSVPAMSHALARLREVFGDPLLVRAGRALVPTPRALELREPVARLLGEADGFVSAVSGHTLHTVQRRFVVRAPDGIPVVFGAALVAALQAVMPRSALQFVSEAHSDPRALREGRVDLDIGAFRAQDPEVQTVTLSEQVLVGVVSRTHPMAAGRWTARRFASQPHVEVTPRTDGAAPVDTALAALGLQRFVAISVPNAYSALIVASRSTLVATVPDRMRRMAVAQGLQVFKLPFDVPAAPMVMAWHPRQAADAAHAWLRNCLLKALSDPYWTPPPVVTEQDAPLPA